MAIWLCSNSSINIVLLWFAIWSCLCECSARSSNSFRLSLQRNRTGDRAIGWQERGEWQLWSFFHMENAGNFCRFGSPVVLVRHSEWLGRQATSCWEQAMLPTTRMQCFRVISHWNLNLCTRYLGNYGNTTVLCFSWWDATWIFLWWISSTNLLWVVKTIRFLPCLDKNHRRLDIFFDQHNTTTTFFESQPRPNGYISG